MDTDKNGTIKMDAKNRKERCLISQEGGCHGKTDESRIDTRCLAHLAGAALGNEISNVAEDDYTAPSDFEEEE